jgi:hypothetical protein
MLRGSARRRRPAAHAPVPLKRPLLADGADVHPGRSPGGGRGRPTRGGRPGSRQRGDGRDRRARSTRQDVLARAAERASILVVCRRLARGPHRTVAAQTTLNLRRPLRLPGRRGTAQLAAHDRGPHRVRRRRWHRAVAGGDRLRVPRRVLAPGAPGRRPRRPLAPDAAGRLVGDHGRADRCRVPRRLRRALPRRPGHPARHQPTCHRRAPRRSQHAGLLVLPG